MAAKKRRTVSRSTSKPEPPPHAATPALRSELPASRRPVRRAARRRSPLPATVIGILALLLAVGALFILARSQGGSSTGAVEGVMTYPNLERGHQTEPVAYAQTPPVGGKHAPTWQNCGVYNQPVPNERAVHSLEHGAVWLTYRPDLPATEVETLRGITRQSGYRLLSPYPDLPGAIVATAWGAQVALDRADDPRLLQFIRRYQQDPAGPEPGAPCTGGQGQPQG